MKTERKTVILLVSIAKEKDTWRNIAENPESVLKDGLFKERN